MGSPNLSFAGYLALPHVHVDVDGVLADFFGAVRSRFANKATDHWRFTGEDGWTLIPKHLLHLYRELDPIPDASVLMDGLKKLRDDSRIRLSVLTAIPAVWRSDPVAAETSTREKKQWVQRHFGLSESDVVVVTRAEKYQFAGPSKVLIDDMEVNVSEWNAAGGYGIHHASASTSLLALSKYLNGEA